MERVGNNFIKINLKLINVKNQLQKLQPRWKRPVKDIRPRLKCYAVPSEFTKPHLGRTVSVKSDVNSIEATFNAVHA